MRRVNALTATPWPPPAVVQGRSGSLSRAPVARLCRVVTSPVVRSYRSSLTELSLGKGELFFVTASRFSGLWIVGSVVFGVLWARTPMVVFFPSSHDA